MNGNVLDDVTMNKKISSLVSVIIPCYNHEKFISESIHSIISQTYRDIELIVVNDGSTDNSHSEISRLVPACDERFSNFIYIDKKNEGIARTLNMALERAQGSFVSCLASDDVFLPTKIESQLRAFDGLDDSVAAVFGDARFIDENSEPLYLAADGTEYRTPSPDRYSSFLEFYCRNREDLQTPGSFGTYISLLKGNYIPAMSVLMRKSHVFEAGLFDDDIRVEDWSLWLKFCRRWELRHVPETVACYRLHQSNITKAFRGNLLADSAKILLRERSFCWERGLCRPWEHAYVALLLGLVKMGRWRDFSSFAGEIGKSRLIRISFGIFGSGEVSQKGS